jgi:Terpene cyclase DEP1
MIKHLAASRLNLLVTAELECLGMPANRLWLLTAAACSVGVCCGLALFLYQRETWLARQQP